MPRGPSPTADAMDAVIVFLSLTILLDGMVLVNLSRAVPFRSLRMGAALLLAAATLSLLALFGFTGKLALFFASGAVGVALACYSIALLILKSGTVPRWTVLQNVVVFLVAFAIMFLYWALCSPSKLRGVVAANAVVEYRALPSEILGLGLSPPDGSEGMTLRRELGLPPMGKPLDVASWVDESPRKAGGPTFVSVARTCSYKTFTPMKVVADTDSMPAADEKYVWERARAIADEIQRACAVTMKQSAWGSEHLRLSGTCHLYYGYDAGISAEVSWVQQGQGKGVLRMTLGVAGKLSPGSPLLSESAE